VTIRRAGIFALVVALAPIAPAQAVAPPVPRDAIEVDFNAGADERVITDVVRPYQPLELMLRADAGVVLLLRTSVLTNCNSLQSRGRCFAKRLSVHLGKSTDITETKFHCDGCDVAARR
jgi:hypothetical protein